MEFTPGMVLDGKVKSIASFGAFINLPEGKTGLVHISEVAASYVSDIRQFLTEGQDVKVKILSVDERGRLSLSLKQAAAKERPAEKADLPAGEREARAERPAKPYRPARVWTEQPQKAEPASFEEKLKLFMADSNSKISGVRQYEHRTRSRKR